MVGLCRVLMVNAVLAIMILTPAGVFAFQIKDVPSKANQMPGPTDKAIAAAKARGLVWVDPSTNVYYKDGPMYGKTKRGEFMPEAVAQAGNREGTAASGKKNRGRSWLFLSPGSSPEARGQ